jgi:hypothetical protein
LLSKEGKVGRGRRHNWRAGFLGSRTKQERENLSEGRALELANPRRCNTLYTREFKGFLQEGMIMEYINLNFHWEGRGEGSVKTGYY